MNSLEKKSGLLVFLVPRGEGGKKGLLYVQVKTLQLISVDGRLN